jgi:hypothetical protein
VVEFPDDQTGGEGMGDREFAEFHQVRDAIGIQWRTGVDADLAA